mmetsp:Transcript_8518/g.12607  ORF Transcript_8518/g.12607 Transcript_8518/m.12607 type:complete len:540 (-) Transcript_8518:85-1704(-)|eukprot:CAMPEP_0196819148 /NCGR_PEP_ID=MMETSP1362-20130617/69219_1 /TAXON_ID=163516 /ORGANISM="Leptocylindrus danicus, Strain CCMP1856" /LENGTH=539 /DNA_ID=CAMNT_0042197519 /DNA_START=10 /DNA_END=1629 /DNA_ORIENTATION=-
MSLNNPFLSDVEGVDADTTEPLVAAAGTHRYVTRDPNLPDGVGGEQQGKSLRGFPIAIIFYIHLIAVLSLALGWGLPAILSVRDDTDAEYYGIAYMALIIGSTALLLSGVVLFILSSMSNCVSFVLKFCLFLTTTLTLIIGITGASGGSVGLALFGFSGFLFMICFMRSVWKSIPLATANLATAAGAIQNNFGLFFVSILFTSATFAWVFVWVLAVIGAYESTADCDLDDDTPEVVNDDGVTIDDTNSTMVGNYADGDVMVYRYLKECKNNPDGFLIFLLFLSYFWTYAVINNTLQTTVAGVVGNWWVNPGGSSKALCSRANRESFLRATIWNFGSICFGSLLLAIVQALRATIAVLQRFSRNDGEDDEDGGVLVCCIQCCLGCVEGALKSFNKYAFVYVGLYGYGYIKAGRKVMNLFQSRGWSNLISETLIVSTLGVLTVIVAIICGIIGLDLEDNHEDWFEAFGDDDTIMVFLLAFVIGYGMTSVCMNLLISAVDTVIVLFAENPKELQTNHPEFFDKMMIGYRTAYPNEFSESFPN